MANIPYWNEGSSNDEDHPRAGWFVVISQEGVDDQVFGPFATEPHAKEFAEHCDSAYEHAH